jgi:hypothetical protein
MLRLTSETRLKKSVEGSFGGLMEVLSQHFPGETEDYTKNLIHDGWCSGPDQRGGLSRKISRHVIARTNLLIQSYALLKTLLDNRGWK